MRILRVISSLDPVTGGPAAGLRSITPLLADRGHTTEVVCLDAPDSAFLRDFPATVHALGPAKSSYRWSPFLMSWLEKNCTRFDVVIIHGLWQFHGWCTRQVCLQLGMPYFVYPHGMLDPWFQRDPSRRLKAVRNWIYWKLIENRVVGDAAALLFTCEEEMRLARQPFRPYHPKAEITVGYGIPEPPAETPAMHVAFRESCFGIEVNRPYLLFLSRIHPKKGVDLLIRAYRKIVDEYDLEHRQYPVLVVAGPGLDTTYGQEMKKLASTLCPPSTVLFAGMLQGAAKWGAFYGCAAFVLPSHQENFGIAVAEALACGKPVLISNKVNICREIEALQAGFVDEDTTDGCHRLIARWINQEDETLQRMGENARNCFLSRFEIGAAVKHLECCLGVNAGR